MKFCKNLQRVVEISDPAYSAFFVNYRMLKKLIKELPSLVPTDQGTSANSDAKGQASFDECPDSPNCAHCSTTAQQNHGDTTVEARGGGGVADGASDSADTDSVQRRKEELGKSPGEIAFFKLLHSEFRKATFFFDKTQSEFEIREERVREGMEIMKQPNSIMVNEKWSMMAKSIFRLYKELLLLETYAIMAYCSFSKILKKHDKVTGYNTRSAFMTNVVSKANFTHYPRVLAMISRCERLYEEVSQRLQLEGKQGLYEDERLFINMISRLNEQVSGTPDSAASVASSEKKQGERKEGSDPPSSETFVVLSAHQTESAAMNTLRSIVEENEALKAAVQVPDGKVELNAKGDRKRAAAGDTSEDEKRARKDC